MTTKIRIGMIGSREYTDKRKIKDTLFDIKQKSEDVQIVSGGQLQGADGIVKKYALEFDMDYVEFPPSHYRHNMHCKLSARHYNKPYYISNYFKRNKQIAEYCHMVIGFIYVYIKEFYMDYKLTSVKILQDLYKKFKLNALSEEFTLQKLVNRSMDLYLLDNNFKSQIHEYKNLKVSGSRL